MRLSDLSDRELLTFYELATRIWKYRGRRIQEELLIRIGKDGLELLRITGAISQREENYLADMPPNLNFIKNADVAITYLEFLDHLDDYAPGCDAALQNRDRERQLAELERREAHQKMIAEQLERNKLDRVVNANRAYEQAEKKRQAVYDLLREGDVSIFDLDFRITSNTATDEIARLMSRLGRTTVVISPGTWGSAFHTSEKCEWLNKGRDRASKFVSIGNLLTIGVEAAVYEYKKRPCHSCFMFWWDGAINPQPEFGQDEESFADTVEIFLGDVLTINWGAFEGFSAEVIDLLRGDKANVMVRTRSLGREIELILPIESLDFPDNINELRNERMLLDQKKLEEKFHLETTQVRKLEELILLLEDGLRRLTQSDLKVLLENIEERIQGITITNSDSISVDYLNKRLSSRMNEARNQVN